MFSKVDIENNSENISLIGQKCVPRLSQRERIMGFIICVLLGFSIQIMSIGSIFGIVTGNPDRFAISFTFGNIVYLLASFFLIGPQRQVQQMFRRERIYFTFLYLLSLVVMIVLLIRNSNFILTSVSTGFQMIAYLFYVFSYIPEGTECLSGCFRRMFNRQQ